MKAIKNVLLNTFARVDDNEASKRVLSGNWVYISKTEWKLNNGQKTHSTKTEKIEKIKKEKVKKIKEDVASDEKKNVSKRNQSKKQDKKGKGKKK